MGADVSERRKRNRVEMMIKRHLGQEIVELVKRFGGENYPLHSFFFIRTHL